MTDRGSEKLKELKEARGEAELAGAAIIGERSRAAEGACGGLPHLARGKRMRFTESELVKLERLASVSPALALGLVGEVRRLKAALAAAQKGEYPCQCGAVTIRCAGPLQDEYEAKLAAAKEQLEIEREATTFIASGCRAVQAELAAANERAEKLEGALAVSQGVVARLRDGIRSVPAVAHLETGEGASCSCGWTSHTKAWRAHAAHMKRRGETTRETLRHAAPPRETERVACRKGL